MRLIGVNIPEEYLNDLNMLVEQNYAANVSELVRLAIRKLLIKHTENMEEYISP